VKIFLHIGQDKTGTFAIQRSLSLAKSILSDHNYICPVTFMQKLRVLLRFPVSGNLCKHNILNLVMYTSKISSLYGGSYGSLILDSEFLLPFLATRVDLLEALSGCWPIHYIVATISNAEILFAVYSQQVKYRGRCLPFGEYLAALDYVSLNHELLAGHLLALDSLC